MRFEREDVGPALPQGEYLARVHHVEERESSRGNPMVVVDYVVLDAGYAGERVRDYFVIDGESPRAAQIGRRRLATLCARTGLEVSPGEDLDLAELGGRTVVIDVREDTMDGIAVARVRSYRAARDPLPY